MSSGRSARRIAATAGIAALVSIGTLSACGQSKQAPETTAPSTSATTTTATTTPTSAPASPAPTSAPASSAPGSSAPTVAPTEKSINPSGGNSFSPTVKAPPAPTAIPGDN